MADLGSHTKIVGAEREQLGVQFKQRYEAGESIRDIADDCGRSYGFVHRVLEEAGTTLRGRGGRNKSHAATA